MQLVACDLDGTIVPSGGVISPRTLAAFEQCERRGIHIVFVTGRPPRWMAPIVETTGHQGLALCGNGAVVLDLATNQVVRSTPLPLETVREVTSRLRRHIPGASFALETLDGYRCEPDDVARYTPPEEARFGTLDELMADSPTVIKMLCLQAAPHHGDLDSDQMLLIARPVLGDIAEVVHSDPGGRMLEISAPGVTKASALAWLAERLQVPSSEVVAFGDMPNDVPMLLWAGVGYAMVDGHPQALAAASRQAPPCAQDGVAQVIEQLLLRRSPDAVGWRARPANG